jgi:cysteine desulfurase
MIYLDYNATTPVLEPVLNAMLPYVRDHHGNPSSYHVFGMTMKAGLSKARHQVANLINADTDEIVFNSGGSESNNQVIKGVFEKHRDKTPHFITSVVEHPSVLVPLTVVEQRGANVTRVPVDGTGMVNPDDVKNAITPDTVLISIMQANNEVGTIQPIAEISKIAKSAGVLMHTDAAQCVGKIDVDVETLGVDFLTIAGHKLYAPAGVGVLFMRRGCEIEPLVHGAAHEQGRRAGTEAVHNITALGVAADLCRDDLERAESSDADSSPHRMRRLRDRLHDLLVEGLGDRVQLHGHPEKRLPNTLNVGFKDVLSGELLPRLDTVAASPGAACHSEGYQASHVLAAMAVPDEFALGAVRFSLGRPTTDDEITQAAKDIIASIKAF